MSHQIVSLKWLLKTYPQSVSLKYLLKIYPKIVSMKPRLQTKKLKNHKIFGWVLKQTQSNSKQIKNQTIIKHKYFCRLINVLKRKLSPQNVSSKCLLKMSPQNSPQNVYSKYLIKMSHQNVS